MRKNNKLWAENCTRPIAKKYTGSYQFRLIICVSHLNAWWSAKTSNPGMASTNSNPVLRWFENRSWTGDATADQRAIQNGLNDSGTYMKSKKRTFENLWK